MHPPQKDAPGVGTEGVQSNRTGQDFKLTGDSSVCADGSERTRVVVAKFQDAYAVVVIGKASRRHVFFGLPAAQKAVERAHARGDFADLVLVRLTPVGEL